MNLNEITQAVRKCTRCPLRETATQPVPGIGCVGAKYFLLGEAPGRNEDKEGIPFIGLAGKRLDKLLNLANIRLNDCYITNVVKCRPPSEDVRKDNRQPRKGEIRACIGWLWEELKTVQPKQVITLGSVPLALFSRNGVKKMHGSVFDVELPIEEYSITRDIGR